jgi:threonine dehydrogenase-like Zn-dependent dehydrogenase
VRPLIPKVLELILSERIDPALVITSAGSFDDAPAILREHFLAGGIKAVLSARP